MQCSSLGNCRAGISADTPPKIIGLNRDCDHCAGMFIWTGADYIGEPTPYSTKNAYYGSIDTAGLKKDSFYLYKAAWTDKSVLHLMPYWDFNEGQMTDVVAYTNLPEAELFLNGRSLGISSNQVADDKDNGYTHRGSRRIGRQDMRNTCYRCYKK